MNDYYTLLVSGYGGKWAIDFGSYDLSDVEFEQDEICEYISWANTKIIVTGDTQGEITRHVDNINATT